MNASVVKSDGRAVMPSIQSRRATRRSRAARVEFWQTVLLSTFVGLVLVANLFIGAVVVFGTVKSQFQTTNGPTDVHTGRFTEMLLDGTFCRTVLFDNKSAETIDDKVVLCNKSVPYRASKGGSRFNWGGD